MECRRISWWRAHRSPGDFGAFKVSFWFPAFSAEHGRASIRWPVHPCPNHDNVCAVSGGAVPCRRPSVEYLSLQKTQMILRKRISFQGFAPPHFAAEIAQKPQCCALFSPLKQAGALCAHDLVGVVGTHV